MPVITAGLCIGGVVLAFMVYRSSRESHGPEGGVGRASSLQRGVRGLGNAKTRAICFGSVLAGL
jgi:hypothetical protein